MQVRSCMRVSENLGSRQFVNSGSLPFIARFLAEGPSLLPLAYLPKAGYVSPVALEGECYRKDDQYERR